MQETVGKTVEDEAVLLELCGQGSDDLIEGKIRT